jgi:hypothetical protein
MNDLYLRDEILTRWVPEDARLLGEWVKMARYDLSSDSETPFKPYSSVSAMGLSRQTNTKQDVVEELDKILLKWYETGWVRMLYQVSDIEAPQIQEVADG